MSEIQILNLSNIAKYKHPLRTHNFEYIQI